MTQTRKAFLTGRQARNPGADSVRRPSRRYPIVEHRVLHLHSSDQSHRPQMRQRITAGRRAFSPTVSFAQRDAFYLTEPDADRPTRCDVAGLEIAARRGVRRCCGRSARPPLAGFRLTWRALYAADADESTAEALTTRQARDCIGGIWPERRLIHRGLFTGPGAFR